MAGHRLFVRRCSVWYRCYSPSRHCHRQFLFNVKKKWMPGEKSRIQNRSWVFESEAYHICHKLKQCCTYLQLRLLYSQFERYQVRNGRTSEDSRYPLLPLLPTSGYGSIIPTSLASSLPLLLGLSASSTAHNQGHSVSIHRLFHFRHHQLDSEPSQVERFQSGDQPAQSDASPGNQQGWRQRTVKSIAPGIFPLEMTNGVLDRTNKSHRSAEGSRDEKVFPPTGRCKIKAQAVLHLAVNQYANGLVFALGGRSTPYWVTLQP